MPATTHKTPTPYRVSRPRSSESALRMSSPGRRPEAATVRRPSRSPRPVPFADKRSVRLPLSESRRLQDQAHHHPQAVAYGVLRAATIVAAIMATSPDPGETPGIGLVGSITLKTARQDHAHGL